MTASAHPLPLVIVLGALLHACVGEDPIQTSATAGALPTGDATTTSSTTEGAETGESTGTTDDTPWTTSGGPLTSSGDATDGETTGPACPPEDPLCQIPPADREPVSTPDGVPGPLPGVYDDLGEAPLDGEVRALIGLPTRDRSLLEARVAAISTPTHPEFGEHLGVDAWMAEHAPPTTDVMLVETWLEAVGLEVTFVASNRLLVAFRGGVAEFNAAFGTTLHLCLRKNPQAGNPPFEVYCTVEGTTLPKFIAERTHGLMTADLPAPTGTLTPEDPKVEADPPGPGAYGPPQIAAAYRAQALYDQGYTGQGATIGVVGAGTVHWNDLLVYWLSFGIDRAPPERIQVMEPVVTKITETILDTQWASSMAPGAAVKLYEGPDARNTALLYVFNEAIARGEVDILTTSFAHREDSEPKALRHQYDESALMAAALGITVLCASGDSAEPDIPCSSPYVLCVGGTEMVVGGGGQVLYESAWELSGSGVTKSFPLPEWQEGIVAGELRGVTDLALNASPYTPMWIRRFGAWESYGGTSFAAPALAGMLAVIVGERFAQGRGRLGLLHPLLYGDPQVQAAFRDVTTGATANHEAAVGWDFPTGWGSPEIDKLADALP